LSQALQGQSRANNQVRPTSEHQQLSRDKGRCIDEAKPCLPEHAVQKMRSKITGQVTLDKYFITPLGMARSDIRLAQRSELLS